MIRHLLQTTSPVLFGYLPMGIAFGVLFQELGYPWYYASLMGLIIFAGSALLSIFTGTLLYMAMVQL